MSAGDPEIVQATGNLQHLIGNAGFRQAEYILDDAAALHPGEGVFHDNADTGEYRIELLLTHA